MRLLILEAEKMLGIAVSKYMRQHDHEVIEYKGNLHDTEKIRDLIFAQHYDAIINCAAIVNQYAEENKAEAIYINSYLPHFLEKTTEKMDTIVVCRSTDCVFSGEKGKYKVNDIPDGKSFYARTKALGELLNNKDLTIRTSLIGLEEINGEGLLAWFLRQSGRVPGYVNAIWTGLTTKEFARELEKLLLQRANGMFHLVPDQAISKFELLQLFEKHFPANRTIIPYENVRVDKSLIQYTGHYTVKIPSYEEMIEEISHEKD